MGIYFINFGYDPEKIDVDNVIRTAVKNGRVLKSYQPGTVYVNYEFGSLQLSGLVQEINGNNKLMGMAMQAATNSVWEVRVSAIDAKGDQKLPEVRRVMVKRPDTGTGAVVATVINPEILPSYAENEILTLQMALFPEAIRYHADLKAYEDTVEPVRSENKLLDGQKLFLIPGFLLPNGFLLNHGEEKAKDKENDEALDDIAKFIAVVKNVKEKHWNEENWYYVITVDTQFGELEIIHPESMLEEKDRALVVPGSIVDCIGHLVADPAMFEYAEGAVFDHENDLKLLCHVLNRKEEERLAGVLADDAEYIPCSGKNAYKGKEAIIRAFYRREHGDALGKVSLGTITESSVAEVCAGMRGVALRYFNEPDYYSTIFVETNEDGKIIRINSVKNVGFEFRADDEEFMQVDPAEQDFCSQIKESNVMHLRRVLMKGFTNSRTMKEGMDLLKDRSPAEKETIAGEMIRALDGCSTRSQMEEALERFRLEQIQNVGKVDEDALSESVIFRAYYEKMVRNAKKQRDSSDGAFELLPAMVTVCELALEAAGKDSDRIMPVVMQTVKYLAKNLNLEKFNRRHALYSSVVRGRALRAHWYQGDFAALKNHKATLIAGALGDILLEPECGDDYDHATYAEHSEEELDMFAFLVMNPICQNMLGFYADIYGEDVRPSGEDYQTGRCYYKDPAGRMSCLGDDCPCECTMECPIYANSLAIQEMKKENWRKAGTYLDGVTLKHPLFAEAWNNLGVCYNSMHEYRKAADAYKKAYDLRNGSYANALYGLAVAFKNLKRYGEALQRCKEYRLKYGDEIGEVEEDIKRIQVDAYDEKDSAESAADSEDEFTADVRRLLGRKDVQCREDIYKIEYAKALRLMDTSSESDSYRARNILNHLEELSYVPAIMFYAHMYESTEDERYYPEAAKRFKKAADLGDGEGARCYADMRMIGKGVQKDPHDAIRYYAMAADKGIPEATFVIGEYFRNRGDRKNALKAYRKSYEGGYAPARMRIRQMERE